MQPGVLWDWDAWDIGSAPSRASRARNFLQHAQAWLDGAGGASRSGGRAAESLIEAVVAALFEQAPPPGRRRSMLFRAFWNSSVSLRESVPGRLAGM